MISAQDLVQARLYESEEAVIRDALRILLRERADLRINLAIHRYTTEQVSLAYAAHIAQVSWAQMRDILHQRGIPLALGPATVEEAMHEVQMLRTYLDQSQ